MAEIQENISSYTKYHKASYERHKQKLCDKQAAYYSQNAEELKRKRREKYAKQKAERERKKLEELLL
jgi:hypothetical protein